MLEFIIELVLGGIAWFFLFGGAELLAVKRRTSPPGYHTDWASANKDIHEHGQGYFNDKYLAGKYDVKDGK